MTESPNPEPSILPDQQEKLRELTTQSWNLELVISGAALFGILQLTDLFDQAYDYLRYNFMSQEQGVQTLLSSLAYSMMKATCYVLFGAFLINFVMRAFWVGLVGLLAVYPSGIHYDRIPFTTPYAQKKMADEMGPLDRYILRLDQRCNIVFAIAFLFVLLLFFVAIAYLLILLIYSVLRPALTPEIWQIVKIGASVFFGLYVLASIVLSLPKVRATPTGTAWQYRLMTVSKLMYWGMHRPFLFITNTFYSHLPYQKILRTMAMVVVVFFVLFMTEYASDLARTDRRISTFNRRHLYTARVDSLFVNPTAYDNQLAEDAYVDVAAIQADVIREPFIRLYIAYPKALDTLLTRLAPEPKWNDTLPRTEKRRLIAEWSNQQTNRLVRISVNDSLYANPDLLFTRRGSLEQRGWQTVLIPSNLKTGKNTLRIALQADSLAKPEELITIPFWYVPEN
ncbi:carbohydrate-binding protein [Spirosoma pulveris]